MANRYRVLVKAVVSKHVDVTADSPEAAITKAEADAGYSYSSNWSRPEVYPGKSSITMSGPADEPLIRMPERWEIYDLDENEKIGKIANAKITAAVRMACADILAKHKAGDDVGPKYVAKLFEKYVGPVFKKYSKLGTYDGEPRRAVAHILAKYAAFTGADYDDVYDAM